MGLSFERFDETAVALYAELGTPDGVSVCIVCLMASVNPDRWAVLKGIRALVGTGKATCRFDACDRCAVYGLVTRRRRPPSYDREVEPRGPSAN